MTRRYDEPVEVQTTAESGLADPNAMSNEPDSVFPRAFIWRGRLYVVRAVLAHWYERRTWWREAAASALLGLRSDDLQGVGAPASTAAQGVAVPVRQRPVRVEPAEREVWRVEAAAGRSSPVGVYDLVNDPGPDEGCGWRLVRLAD